MTCRELADFLADYLSGDLAEDVRAAFESHLAECPNCRSYLATYKVTIDAGRRAFIAPDALTPEKMPAELVAAIMSALNK